MTEKMRQAVDYRHKDMNLMLIKFLNCILLLVSVLAVCTALNASAEISPAEEKQQIIKIYLEKLAADKLLEIRLSKHSDFDKSGSKLLDSIIKALPKYYRLEKTASQAFLSPTQPRMFYKYGEYTGNVELPIIEYSDSPKPIELLTNIINDVLPAYQNADNNIKVIFKDVTMRVINKGDNALKLDKITLYYNGTFIDKILDSPLELAPFAASGEISLDSVIKRDLGLIEKRNSRSAQESQQVKTNFGFGIVYGNTKDSTQQILGLVNTYSVYELVRNMTATASLESHLVSSSPKDADFESEKQYDFKMEFDFGKASMKQKNLDSLEKIGQAMKKYPHIKGIIEGHTDNVGSKETNQRISELRANAAKEYMVRTYAIDPGRIEAKGFGMTMAIANNSTPSGRALNRRIEGRFWGLNNLR